jgi:DNA-binding GntR family transcriptional regulator
MTAEPVDLHPRRRRPNLADEVATHIRDGILAGRLKPGQSID